MENFKYLVHCQESSTLRIIRKKSIIVKGSLTKLVEGQIIHFWWPEFDEDANIFTGKIITFSSNEEKLEKRRCLEKGKNIASKNYGRNRDIIEIEDQQAMTPSTNAKICHERKIRNILGFNRFASTLPQKLVQEKTKFDDWIADQLREILSSVDELLNFENANHNTLSTMKDKLIFLRDAVHEQPSPSDLRPESIKSPESVKTTEISSSSRRVSYKLQSSDEDVDGENSTSKRKRIISSESSSDE